MFTSPLAATVVDLAHNPLNGVVVTFTAPATGASGTFADTGNATTTATTNASGVATATLISANGTTGAYTVTAMVAGLSTPAYFSLANTPRAGPPAAVAATSGTPQSAAISAAFLLPLAATVVDAAQNPVAGVSVIEAPTGAAR